MSLQTNAANVSYASKLSVDKIVGILTGSYNSATQTTTLGGYLYQFAIPHTFTRPVFCELLISTDGKTYQDGGTSAGSIAAISYADSSNIYVTTGNSTGIIFYKVICSWIDNYDTTNPLITPVLNTTNKAYFDSRQNYQKVFLQNTITSTATNADNISNVFHNLGYQPNYKIFFESVSGQVWPAISGGTQDFWLYDITQSECFGIMDTAQLKIDCFIPSGGHSTRIWYRIYLDS